MAGVEGVTGHSRALGAKGGGGLGLYKEVPDLTRVHSLQGGGDGDRGLLWCLGGGGWRLG